MKKTLEERFWEKVDKSGDCWLWTACCFKNGYGAIKIDGTMKLAHRVAHELVKGPIPEGLCVCHTCDNPKCVNPNHLWIGTDFDNSHDMVLKGRAARQKGETNGSAKLTKQQVIKIRTATGVTQKVLAREYGVSKMQISFIRNNKSWKHLIEPLFQPHELRSRAG